MRNVIAVLLLGSVLASSARGSEDCGVCTACISDLIHEIKTRGYLGMGLHFHERAREAGVEVVFVEEGSPADRAGVREGDRIVRLDDQSWESPASAKVREVLFGVRPGQRVRVEVLRNGERRELSLQAVPMPLRATAEALGSYLLTTYGQQQP